MQCVCVYKHDFAIRALKLHDNLIAYLPALAASRSHQELILHVDIALSGCLSHRFGVTFCLVQDVQSKIVVI